MQAGTAILRGMAVVAALVAGLLTVSDAARSAQGQANFMQNGEASFVVTQFDYALSQAASETGACPRGMTQAQSLTAAFARQPGEAPQNRAANIAARRAQLVATVGPICIHPEQAPPDASQRIVEGGANIPAYGIDLDGQVSRANGRAAPGTCAHDDFRSFHGERGIDNQFFRVVGCSPRFQPDADPNHLTTEMLTGAWGVLLTLRGVDDARNDPHVEVDFYANADPIQLSPNREAVPNVTYARTQDPRFRATAQGRIVNGVLTTDPVDVRFKSATNALIVERPLQDARLRVTLSADGVLDGYLAGYTPVEAMYDVQYGFRTARDASGAALAAPEPTLTAIGAGLTFGHTCNGVYHALVAAADGHRDPQTGRCTSISTQYRLRAIPAFVVDAETQSANEALIARPQGAQ